MPANYGINLTVYGIVSGTHRGTSGQDFIQAGVNPIWYEYEGQWHSYNNPLLGGNYTLSGYKDDDTLITHGGNDHLFGGLGNDTLIAGYGDDHLNGGAGDDYLFGDNGADVLLGGTGNDWLNGGNGPDRLDGGRGNDTYWFGGADQLQFNGKKGGQDLAVATSWELQLGDHVQFIGAGADDTLNLFSMVQEGNRLGFGMDDIHVVGEDIVIGDIDSASSIVFENAAMMHLSFEDIFGGKG